MRVSELQKDDVLAFQSTLMVLMMALVMVTMIETIKAMRTVLMKAIVIPMMVAMTMMLVMAMMIVLMITEMCNPPLQQGSWSAHFTCKSIACVLPVETVERQHTKINTLISVKKISTVKSVQYNQYSKIR